MLKPNKIEPFSAAATLEGVSPLKDGGMSVRFHTQELNKEDKVGLMGYYQSFGYLLFAPEPLSEDDIPDKPLPSVYGDKSPSERLHAVLYLLWKQEGAEGDSEIFYRQNMEKYINHAKGKLKK